jgi:transcriptional regulator with XRE-family HTH domain
MYYENFEKLLDIKGLKPADVAKATGIKTSTLSNWKKGAYTPKLEKLKLIADFFEVDVSLITKSENESESPRQQAKLDALITQDLELKEAIQKYMKLSDNKKSQVIEYINLIYGSEVNKK